MGMVRQVLALSAALVVGGTLVDATSAQAQTGYYVATVAQPATQPTLVTRDTLWSLKGDAYVAARSGGRDASLCDAVARSAGALTGFTVAGKAYDADQLAKCNAHAKGGAAGAAVAQAR